MMRILPLVPANRNYFLISIAMMTALILLINVSCKIFLLHGVLFTASSLYCPFIAVFYFFLLKNSQPREQRQALNQALLSLYFFSLGIYILINLPAAGNLRINMAYGIVFEDVPKKFFSLTLAFFLSFYLPYLYFFPQRHLNSQALDLAGGTSSANSYLMREISYDETMRYQALKQRLILALGGGFSFFLIDFSLLFHPSHDGNWVKILLGSFLTCATLSMLLYFLGLILLSYKVQVVRLTKRWFKLKLVDERKKEYLFNPLYQYLVVFSLTILLICLSCEYRFIFLPNGWLLAASGLLFPLNLLIFNLSAELYSYQANITMMKILLLAQLGFDFFLMLAVLLPSPDFFNLNPFYAYIMPRRIFATTLSLLLAFGSNTFLLEKLKSTVYGQHPGIRIFIANVVANSLLCLVNYSILFVGIFPYEQIVNLSLCSWTYKFILTLLSLPLSLYFLQQQSKDRVNKEIRIKP